MKEIKIKKKKLSKKLKDKFINWIFKDLIYDAEIRLTRENIASIKKELYQLEDFRKIIFQEFEQIRNNFNELEKRQDLFNESVYRFLPKVYEVYRKNLEIDEFRQKYRFNRDAKELRNWTNAL